MLIINDNSFATVLLIETKMLILIYLTSLKVAKKCRWLFSGVNIDFIV